jgi:GntR family transcriptional regulator
VNIDPRSHIPIYLQIVDALRAAIAAGVYRPGETLPSLRALAIDLKVNPNTVQRAYDELEREGLVYSQRGKGLFVSDNGTSAAQTHARESVGRRFEDVLRAAAGAGMTADEARKIFDTTAKRFAQRL